MPTQQALVAALRQADAAGDTAGARRIAAMIQSPPKPGMGSTLMDVAKSAWGGLVSPLEIPAALTGMTDAAADWTANKIRGALGTAPVSSAKISAAEPGITPARSFTPVNRAVAAIGGEYAPKTTPGRYAHAVASMATNAIAPEGIPAKIAEMVAPGVASQAAQDAAKASGLGQTGQNIAGFVGGGLGGAGAGGLRAALDGRAAPRALATAEQPAAKSVRAALAMDGTTPAQALQAVSNGKLPMTAAPGLGQLAETVAQQPGVGAVRLQDAVGQRMAGARDRALQAVTTHLGVDPEAAQGNIDSVVKAGQQSASQLYDPIRADPGPVWNADLARLAQRPAIKKAVGVVANNMLNAGESPTAAGFQVDPDTGWTLPQTLDNVEQQPTASTWIGVHQALGQTVERSPLTGKPLPDSQSPGNFGIRIAGNDLRNALTGAIPGYSDALAVSGDYLSTKGAFDKASGTLFRGPVSDFNDMWSSLGNDSQQNAARAAIANDILTRSENNQFLPGQFKSPGVQQKLTTAFGPDAASAFTGQMEGDLAERATYNRILQGSPTARRTNLEAAYQAQNAPSGIGQNVARALQNGTGVADTIASFTHPVTAVTRGLSLASKALGGGGGAALPWEDPETNAQLGQVLSDPGAFSDLLTRMSAQDALDTANKAALQQGLLKGFSGALPGLLSGLVAPSPEAAPPAPAIELQAANQYPPT